MSDLDEKGAAFWLVLYQGNDKEEERAITEITTLRDDLICYVIHNGYKRFLAYLETGYIDSYYYTADRPDRGRQAKSGIMEYVKNYNFIR